MALVRVRFGYRFKFRASRSSIWSQLCNTDSDVPGFIVHHHRSSLSVQVQLSDAARDAHDLCEPYSQGFELARRACMHDGRHPSLGSTGPDISAPLAIVTKD